MRIMITDKQHSTQEHLPACITWRATNLKIISVHLVSHRSPHNWVDGRVTTPDLQHDYNRSATVHRGEMSGSAKPWVWRLNFNLNVLSPSLQEFSLPSITLFERCGLRGRRVILTDGSVNLQLAGGCSRVQSVLVEGGMWVHYNCGVLTGSARMQSSSSSFSSWCEFERFMHDSPCVFLVGCEPTLLSFFLLRACEPE